jgi:hypothetical protein
MRWRRAGHGPALALGGQSAARAAKGGRGRPVDSPEYLRELGGLPVAHGTGHGLHRKRALGQQLGGAVHARALELAAEAGAADLGERALELAPRRGDLAGDAPEREIVLRIAQCDHLTGLAVEVTPSLHGGGPHVQ